MRLLVVLAACGSTAQPIAHRGGAVEAERGGPEWQMLARVQAGKPGALGELAQLYQGHGDWDEYAAVRTRMLEDAPPGRPGEPFPRIGSAYERRGPPTVLSRWLNPTLVPELYRAYQVSLDELGGIVTRAYDHAPDPERRALAQVREGDLDCIRLDFDDAVRAYDAALAHLDAADPRAAAIRVRRDDARAIVVASHGSE